MNITDEMNVFYGDGKELERLSSGIGPLEWERTRELIGRYLPPAPAVVYDIGGAYGAYSFWMAGLGYRVHLVDAVPVHIEEARRRQDSPGSPRLAEMGVGDARELSFADSSAEVLMLHGPLYHLTQKADRLLALREAHRVLKPGGLLLAFAISSYASSIVGIQQGWVWNSDYLTRCEGEVCSGNHIRPDSWDGYFHHPRVLVSEMEECGFACDEVLGIHGPGWMVPDFDGSWVDPARREVILQIARMMEREPVLSPHIMGVGKKG